MKCMKNNQLYIMRLLKKINFVDKRKEATQKLHNSIDFNNLKYNNKIPTANADFKKFIDAGTLFDEIM